MEKQTKINIITGTALALSISGAVSINKLRSEHLATDSQVTQITETPKRANSNISS